jgi:hypothetical protein
MIYNETKILRRGEVERDSKLGSAETNGPADLWNIELRCLV